MVMVVRAVETAHRRLVSIPVLMILALVVAVALGCVRVDAFSAHATVRYSYGEGRRVEVFAVGGHAAGAEMTICYGTHPDMVFGAHYGFVPAAQAASCYTVLRLNEATALTARQVSHHLSTLATRLSPASRPRSLPQLSDLPPESPSIAPLLFESARSGRQVDAALFGIGAGRVLDAQRAAETQANDDRWTDERARAPRCWILT